MVSRIIRLYKSKSFWISHIFCDPSSAFRKMRLDDDANHLMLRGNSCATLNTPNHRVSSMNMLE